jgi:uroporphyrinogen decarboxylase
MTGKLTFADPEEWKKSIPLYSDEELNILEKRAKALYENTDFSICGTFLKGGLGTNALFAGHTVCDWLCILISEKKYAAEILRATAERAVENISLYLEAVGKYIDTILLSGTDFGSQKSEIFKPEIFSELHMPNYKLMTDYIHENSNVKVIMHSCGSIFNIIEYIIQAGIDILNPVQTNTANMQPEILKKKFGSRIVFWGGGADTQTVLPYGTSDEVREHVRQRINTFAPGGGFVFTPIHNLQYGVPVVNIIEMINTVIKYGSYPIN